MNRMQEEALKLATAGFAVFPLYSIGPDGECTCGMVGCTDRGKHPKKELVPRGVKQASRDPVVLREWFDDSHGLANIGIATGKGSGCTVLDVDIGPGKKGAETWQELAREGGEPTTLTARTGSGGMHFFFKYNSALNTSSNTLGPGVDCRNDGGYVVAAPSIHKSGNEYAWENWDECVVDGKLMLADLPAHLSKKRETRGRKKGGDPTRKKYTVEQFREMLAVIPADDRDVWRKVFIIAGREYARSDEAYEAACEWADKWGGQKGRGHDEIQHECFYVLSQQDDDGGLSMGTIVHLAIANGWAPKAGQVPIDKFFYYAPGNNFIYRPTGAFWPGESVDASCSPVNDNGTIMKPTTWLKSSMLVTSMTRDPDIDIELTKGYDCLEGEIIESAGSALYNGYRPPTIKLGDARLARPFVEHVMKVFNKNGDADMFLDYMAHRVQYPGVKARFALLIAGEQGVGKDTAISMCYPAIGTWNIANIGPMDLESGFNEFMAQVLIVVSEAGNIQEMSKFMLNERMKNMIAGLPDHVVVNPKYGQKFSVRLHNGTIITTNHMTSGIYIPPDDRRYDVIECATRREMGFYTAEDRAAYFGSLWEWYLEMHGAEHIATFLHDRDLSRFSASSGQRITKAHKIVVASGMTGDDWLVDVLEALGNPSMVRADTIWTTLETIAQGEMSRKEFNNKLGHAMPRQDYTKVYNYDEKDGRWSYVDEAGVRRRVNVYCKSEMTDEQARDALKETLRSGKTPF